MEGRRIQRETNGRRRMHGDCATPVPKGREPGGRGAHGAEVGLELHDEVVHDAHDRVLELLMEWGGGLVGMGGAVGWNEVGGIGAVGKEARRRPPWRSRK